VNLGAPEGPEAGRELPKLKLRASAEGGDVAVGRLGTLILEGSRRRLARFSRTQPWAAVFLLASPNRPGSGGC